MPQQANLGGDQAYSIAGFMAAFGISRFTVYKEINSGRLKTFKVGRRRLISTVAAEKWRKAMEAA